MLLDGIPMLSLLNFKSKETAGSESPKHFTSVELMVCKVLCVHVCVCGVHIYTLICGCLILI